MWVGKKIITHNGSTLGVVANFEKQMFNLKIKMI
jgi:hypothetical protein